MAHYGFGRGHVGQGSDETLLAYGSLLRFAYAELTAMFRINFENSEL